MEEDPPRGPEDPSVIANHINLSPRFYAKEETPPLKAGLPVAYVFKLHNSIYIGNAIMQSAATDRAN